MSKVKTEKKRMQKGRVVAWLLLTLLLLVAVSGTVLSRYISTSQDRAQMLSSDFYISSNYLELKETLAEYEVTDWGNQGVVFQLYNYEKENVDLIAGMDIEYDIEVPEGWSARVYDSNKTEITRNAAGYYVMPGDGATRESQSIQLTGSNQAETDVAVKVRTVSPYAYELEADFHLESKSLPEYQVKDKGNYVAVTVYSNDYAGAVTVNWSDAFSPDRTNAYMATWTDAGKPASMTLEANTTYELIFFKNTNATYNKDTTGGVNIQIG